MAVTRLLSLGSSFLLGLTTTGVIFFLFYTSGPTHKQKATPELSLYKKTNDDAGDIDLSNRQRVILLDSHWKGPELDLSRIDPEFKGDGKNQGQRLSKYGKEQGDEAEELKRGDPEKRQQQEKEGETTEEAPSTKKPRLSEAQVKARFEERLHRVRNACSMYFNNSGLFRPKKHGWASFPVYPKVMNVSVLFCALAKVSSTTWSSFLANIKRHMQKNKIQGTEDRKHVDDEVMFTFVREPYGRMLSGWVDKLLTPNTMFWEITGRFIVRKFRPNPSLKALKCGHDVTFPEFVKYVVHSQRTGEHMNGHFIPIHDQCDMCTLPYRYIGFLETISEDMPYITKAIRSPINYTRAYDSDTIAQNSKMVLWTERTGGVKRCMDLDEAARRLWKKFQCRGLISKHERFPYRAETAVNITLEEFTKVALEAHRRSLQDPAGLKMQRTEALREAFASVPIQDRLDAQTTLFLDFEMFGFDPKLEDVFPKQEYVRDKNFSYFQIFDD